MGNMDLAMSDCEHVVADWSLEMTVRKTSLIASSVLPISWLTKLSHLISRDLLKQRHIKIQERFIAIK